MRTAIHVEKLSKSYGNRLAIDNISLSVECGTVFGLLGANGAGKSTTMECILGTRTADSGTVTVLGYDPKKDRRSLFQNVGVQFQECDYQPEIKVFELCEETACLYKNPSDWKELCVRFGIGSKIDSAVKNLSGGERQRLSIVLALIPNPKLVFLDELTTGLDAKARRDVWKILSDLKSKVKMEKGVISNKTEKGYCFIRSSTGESIFVHINNVGREIYEQLAKGSKVLFDYEETARGKSATNIIIELPENSYSKVIDFSEEQMKQGEMSTYLNDIIAETFEGSGKWNNRPIRYIFLSLIRRRPRDLINLCTLAARNANAEGRNLIVTEDWEEVFEQYSSSRLQDTINEHKYELPDIERLLLGMKPSHEMKKTEKPFVYGKERLFRKIEGIMQNGKFYFANNKECTVEELIAFMYKINFLNARKDAIDGFIDRKYFEDNKYITSKGVDFGYDWEVHPAFRWALYPEARDVFRHTDIPRNL